MTRSEKMWTFMIFGTIPAIILAAFLFVPPIVQNTAYHDFADQRVLFGIPNFWNVASNAAFLGVAAFGTWVLRLRWAHVQELPNNIGVRAGARLRAFFRLC